MSFDLSQLGFKLKKYREQFDKTIDEVSQGTGIKDSIILSYENGTRKPSGDDILILADYFKCDYNFFISNERTASFEQTDMLFRRYGSHFGKDDKWAVQEFLYLCECEEFLIQAMATSSAYRSRKFYFKKVGDYYKGHGASAAAELRKYLGSPSRQLELDIFHEFRRIGIHVFRRRLNNSNISGLYVKHPIAGNCILINYEEDIYRQRFTAAHEAGHAILDSDDVDVMVSFRGEYNLVELRANTFASNLLMPAEALASIPSHKQWDKKKVVIWANKFKVSIEAFSIALKEHGLISQEEMSYFRTIAPVSFEMKTDPELPDNLPSKIYARKQSFLQVGLSDYYVGLCFEAYHQGILSAARLAEMLLISQSQIAETASMYGRKIAYAD